jgi:hypothetical protein
MKLFFTAIFLMCFFSSIAQQKVDSIATKNFDSTSKKNILALDTSAKKFNPKIATFRSAVLPGWGQIYNKKYWKLPIVYGALGVSAGIFFFNLKTYKKLKQAVIYRSDADPSNDILVAEEYRNLSTASLRSARSIYRQNIDYSVLAFIVLWGLNVVDATVDAHLKEFDVSDDISFKINPGYNKIGNTTGLGLVFSFKNNSAKTTSSLR